jgi:DNA polymerase
MAQSGRSPLRSVRADAATCTACELYRIATQTVFGEGPDDASVMLVGEQPGDREDRSGHPFVGPAGRVLDDALTRAEIDREAVYITNAVKHFRNEQRGKRRIHKKPALAHVRACRPWLEAELSLIRPRVVVALGATAVQALLPPNVKVTVDRGKLVGNDPPTLVTVHPSSILRARDEEDRGAHLDAFIEDLRAVHTVIDG